MSHLTLRSILATAIALPLFLTGLPTNSATDAATNVLSGDQSSIEFRQSMTETIGSVPNSNGKWFTYTVPMEPNNGMPCCLTNEVESICNLDNRTNSWSSSLGQSEDSKILNIYLKMDSDIPSDLFLAGSECKIETNNTPVYKIRGVAQKQSISFLNDLIDASSQDRQIADKALAAIAMLQGNDAHSMLEKIANSENGKQEHEAIFWLGEARNKAGYESLVPIVDDKTRDDKTRARAVFALSMNNFEGSSDKLVELAKTSANEKVQGESVFWLAQNHKAKANEVISYILNHSDNSHVRKKAVFSLAQIFTKASWQQLTGLAQSNADREVQEEAIFWLSQNEEQNPVAILMALAKGNNPTSIKKKAVFALSQLKSSQSTPALTELIETATEKSVKKEALFWLGQSNDSNALDYLERVLTSNLEGF